MTTFRLWPKSDKFLYLNYIYYLDYLDYIDHDYKFDLIVSNPPYFENGLLNVSKWKATSRHEACLPLINLFEKSKELLTKKGEFVLILPAQSASKWINNALKMNLFCFKEITIYGKPNLPKRSILFFSKENKEIMIEELIIRNLDNTYTEDYKQLTLDFHGVELWFTVFRIFYKVYSEDLNLVTCIK